MSLRILAALAAAVMQLALLHYAHSMEQPPMSPAQDARARQMREAVEAASKVPLPKQDCVQISERVCVSEAELKRRQAK